MVQLSAKLRGGETFVTYWCQGCQTSHVVFFGAGHPKGQQWEWDRNVDAPTFSPSVLTRSGHHVPGVQMMPDGRCGFCVAAQVDGGPSMCQLCHTFIKAGMVQFLDDCTHQFAGQTLPLPDLPEHMRD